MRECSTLGKAHCRSGLMFRPGRSTVFGKSCGQRPWAEYTELKESNDGRLSARTLGREIVILETNSRTIHETTLNPRRMSGLVFCSAGSCDFVDRSPN